MRIFGSIFWGVLLGTSGMLYAAEAAPPEAPSADATEEQTAEEMLAAEAALEAREGRQADPETEDSDNVADAPIDADQPETPGRLEDEDFVPTIQISEDLSVSFPVDI